MPFCTTSGPSSDTAEMWAACTSGLPPPLMGRAPHWIALWRTGTRSVSSAARPSCGGRGDRRHDRDSATTAVLFWCARQGRPWRERTGLEVPMQSLQPALIAHEAYEAHEAHETGRAYGTRAADGWVGAAEPAPSVLPGAPVLATAATVAPTGAEPPRVDAPPSRLCAHRAVRIAGLRAWARRASRSSSTRQTSRQTRANALSAHPAILPRRDVVVIVARRAGARDYAVPAISCLSCRPRHVSASA